MHSARSSILSIGLSVLVVALLLAAWSGSVAAQASCTVADGSDALPGFGTSAMPQLQRAVSASIVGAGTYGLNVDPLGAGSTHHRVSGAIAGAVHVVPWLAIGLRVQGRYDLVSSGARTDDGLFGYSALALRLSTEPIAGLTLGLDAQAMVFGAEAPSFELGSTSVLLRALGAYAIDLGGSRFVIALNVGYFLDNSRGAASRGVTDNLSSEDRLSLGVSDVGAVVASLAGAYVTDGLDVYAELSARIHPDGAVLASSPVRVGAGARIWFLPEVLFLGVGLDVRVTAQSIGLVAAGATNAPVEPALHAQLSLGVRIGAETPPGVGDVEDAPPVAPPVTVEEPAVTPTTGIARGRVVDGETPIAGATVELTSDAGGSFSAVTDPDGRWEIGDVPLGAARFRVTAEGREPVEGTLTVSADSPVEASATMRRVLPQGEIRGVVQASNGSPLAAQIVIRPLGRELTADSEGNFAAEVPPGEYDVEVAAPGHRSQTRHITVVEQGVVVLNVQLRAGRSR